MRSILILFFCCAIIHTHAMYIWVGLYHLAAQEGDIAYAKNMLELPDITPDITDEYHRNTALHHAAKAGKVEFIMWLILSYQINLNAQNLEGLTPLHVALLTNQFDVAEYLLMQPTINCNLQDTAGNTPLYYLVEQQNQYLIAKALHHGADPRVKNNERISPLIFAKKHAPKSIYPILKEHVKKLKNKKGGPTTRANPHDFKLPAQHKADHSDHNILNKRPRLIHFQKIQ